MITPRAGFPYDVTSLVITKQCTLQCTHALLWVIRHRRCFLVYTSSHRSFPSFGIHEAWDETITRWVTWEQLGVATPVLSNPCWSEEIISYYCQTHISPIWFFFQHTVACWRIWMAQTPFWIHRVILCMVRSIRRSPFVQTDTCLMTWARAERYSV